ncbi:hypothetical protein PSUB009319_40630 [Ralstonia sp. SET104]|nr:hypothetical protein PSUB009319_40630 [Ralstonia sp. SET104]
MQRMVFVGSCGAVYRALRLVIDTATHCLAAPFLRGVFGQVFGLTAFADGHSIVRRSFLAHEFLRGDISYSLGV